jgi:hypothetical protein
VAALTDTERRCAGRWRGERDIAQELFVTPKAIEIKLGSVRASSARRRSASS